MLCERPIVTWVSEREVLTHSGVVSFIKMTHSFTSGTSEGGDKRAKREKPRVVKWRAAGVGSSTSNISHREMQRLLQAKPQDHPRERPWLLFLIS